MVNSLLTNVNHKNVLVCMYDYVSSVRPTLFYRQFTNGSKVPLLIKCGKCVLRMRQVVRRVRARHIYIFKHLCRYVSVYSYLCTSTPSTTRCPAIPCRYRWKESSTTSVAHQSNRTQLFPRLSVLFSTAQLTAMGHIIYVCI